MLVQKLEMQIYVMDIIAMEGAKNGRIYQLVGNLVRFFRERWEHQTKWTMHQHMNGMRFMVTVIAR